METIIGSLVLAVIILFGFVIVLFLEVLKLRERQGLTDKIISKLSQNEIKMVKQQ